MKESLPWMHVTVFGVPHAATQDDEYMGYGIPKGAGVIYNVWTLQRTCRFCAKAIGREAERDSIDIREAMEGSQHTIETIIRLKAVVYTVHTPVRLAAARIVRIRVPSFACFRDET
ncbi:hypothetical protein BJ170DRAFT_103991 [Xylariales sp. AK1849]|nr:hypothetical protein BJ170DRAFT_103991 [Xylariales sp. AK1849]